MAGGVHAGVVGQQHDALAGDEMQRVREQDVDSGTHLPGRRGTADEGQHDHMMRAHNLLILGVLFGCAGPTAIQPIRPIRPAAEPTAATALSTDSLLASLTPREKIGQLIVPWLRGNYTPFCDSSLQVAERWVGALRVGGVIISLRSPVCHPPQPNPL